MITRIYFLLLLILFIQCSESKFTDTVNYDLIDSVLVTDNLLKFQEILNQKEIETNKIDSLIINNNSVLIAIDSTYLFDNNGNSKDIISTGSMFINDEPDNSQFIKVRRLEKNNARIGNVLKVQFAQINQLNTQSNQTLIFYSKGKVMDILKQYEAKCLIDKNGEYEKIPFFYSFMTKEIKLISNQNGKAMLIGEKDELIFNVKNNKEINLVINQNKTNYQTNVYEELRISNNNFFINDSFYRQIPKIETSLSESIPYRNLNEFGTYAIIISPSEINVFEDSTLTETNGKTITCFSIVEVLEKSSGVYGKETNSRIDAENYSENDLTILGKESFYHRFKVRMFTENYDELGWISGENMYVMSNKSTDYHFKFEKPFVYQNYEYQIFLFEKDGKDKSYDIDDYNVIGVESIILIQCLNNGKVYPIKLSEDIAIDKFNFSLTEGRIVLLLNDSGVSQTISSINAIDNLQIVLSWGTNGGYYSSYYLNIQLENGFFMIKSFDVISQTNQD